LAGHLQEHYESLIQKGIVKEAAYAQTCGQTWNWHELNKGITSAEMEVTMIDRVKQIWVPSLVTPLASWGVLTVLIWSGTQPIISHPGEPRG
jgi:hypothetical protein